MKVPKIVEAREMNLWEAVAWAMDGQTRLIDAQVRLCIWETERIVKQARAKSTWDTCFHRCLWELERAWEKRPGQLKVTPQQNSELIESWDKLGYCGRVPELDEAGKDALRERARGYIETDSESHSRMSDEWIAARVRMLLRTDIDHEGILCAARDRIMRLSLKVSELARPSNATGAEHE